MSDHQLFHTRMSRNTREFLAFMLVISLISVNVIPVLISGLTVVGTWIGTWEISTDPLTHFAQWWPRNFTIALLVEGLLAQPVARLVMHHYHRRVDARAAAAA